MQIAVAQISSNKGNIALNTSKHLQIIHLIKGVEAKAIFFPELSITGYEPTLVENLNFRIDDPSLSKFKSAAKKFNLLIGIGVPLHSASAPQIGQVMFHSDGSSTHYAKKYLHPDEISFFAVGRVSPMVTLENLNLGLAICYEISREEHMEDIISQGADIIIAPVAKSLEGVTAAHSRLSAIAKKHNTPVLMSNCVGPSDNFLAAGQSAVWGPDGQLLQILGEKEEGVLILNTEKNSCEKIVI